MVGDPHFRRRAAILIDLPGYGYSDKPWEYGYTIREQALVVNEVIRAIGLRDYFIYGHSMGEALPSRVLPRRRRGSRTDRL
ncbi:alpha/beta fold hydrolase [Edwardsiella anguillarum]|nr:alpha/beta fold hydrolase [Edwardsiella anguillarum]